MRNSVRSLLIVTFLVGILLGAAGLPTAAHPTSSTSNVQASPDADFKSSPVMFIENAGQWDGDARFQVWGGPAGTMWLAEDAIWITLFEAEDTGTRRGSDTGIFVPSPRPRVAASSARAVNIKLSFPGSNPNARIETLDPLDTVVSYFFGNDPDKWQPDVPVWGSVRYVDLYPGIDLELSSGKGQWDWQLIAKTPTPSSSQGESRGGGGSVRLQVEGAAVTSVEQGELRLANAAGTLALPLPQADFFFQVEGEAESGQAASWTAAAGAPDAAGVRAPADNPDDLLYSTFVGGHRVEWSSAIAVGETGSAYITGSMNPAGFPISGSFGPSYDYLHVFVAKINPTGSDLAFVVLLGGAYAEHAGQAIAVDETGSAFVTGWTQSDDFPTTPGAFDTSFNGSLDAFAVRLNPAGNALVYSTYLGGSGGEDGYGIALDEVGSAFVTGSTGSNDFPTTPGAFDTSHNGSSDAFVVRLNPAGSELDFSTYLGGSSRERGEAIAVDGAGSAFVTGWTQSGDFPSTPGAFDPSYSGSSDAFVAMLNPAGSGLAYGTFLGGASDDSGRAIAVDGAGSAFVTGETFSSDFPTTPGAFDTSYNGGDGDAFAAKMNPAGSGLDYATYLGGSGLDSGSDIAVDGAGSAYVTGEAGSGDFPATPGAFDTSYNGGGGTCYFGVCFDAFVARLNPAGSGLDYATYLGGSCGDSGNGIAVDAAGSAYVAGGTESDNFPTTPGAFDVSYNWNLDAFVVKLELQPNNSYGSWTGTGPEGGFVNTLAINPNTATLYAGTEGGGVFRSSDGGGNWFAANNGLTNSLVNTLAIDPVTPATLYAGTDGGGVYKSSDGGENWHAANNGLTDNRVNALAIDPATPSIVYAGTRGSGVYKSSDGGVSWSAINTGLTNSHVNALAIDPDTPTTLYAGTGGGGVFKTTDSGEGWIAVNTGLSASTVFTLAVDPATPTTLYAATSGGGVFKSVNGAGSWSAINSGLSDSDVYRLAIDPDTPAILYAGTWSGVFRSSNAGGNWGLTGPPPTGVSALAIDPVDSTTLYAGIRGGGVYKSSDSGGNWSETNRGLNAARVFALGIDPVTPATIYAGTWWRGVFKSSDSAGSWNAVNSGLTNTDVLALAIDPTTPSTLYAGTWFGGVYKSSDSAGNWSRVNNGLANTDVRALAIDPATPATLYAGTKGGGVFKSTDSGGSWSAANNGLTDSDVRALAIDPVTPSTIYAGTEGGGVFKSTNSGGDWIAVNSGLTAAQVYALAIDLASPITLYAGTEGGVYKSSNGGGSWSAAGTGMTDADVRALAIDPTAPTTLYAGTDGGGVFKSADGGGTWLEFNTGLIDKRVYALAIDPETPARLFAGTRGGGVFVTRQLVHQIHLPVVLSDR